jgi:small-conductance mechanosensitive channel
MAGDGAVMSFPASSFPASRIESLDAWLVALARPSTLIELSALLGCVLLAGLLAWLLARGVRHLRHASGDSSILFGESIVDGVLFPLLLLSLAYAVHALLLALQFPQALFKVAIPVLLALVVIRLSVKVLQVAFKDAPMVRVLERTVSWLAWALMVLWVSGLLPIILDELDQIKWKVGASTVSVRAMLQGALAAGVVLLITLWISAALETRLLRAATGSELSLRKAISNASRAALMFVGLLLALSSVGIDLTALSVLGGAIGVGVGFGLQKLAANYVSGFVMLAERSVRIGDSVRVDNFEGRITDIKARYTVVRAPSGRESIVPNEMFIINRIENLSLTDSRVQQSTVVSVGYDSDEELVMRLLIEAAVAQARVLADPAPGANLTNFGADGLEFTLNYWIVDPENGLQNLRSAINLAILKSLREHHVEIPYPQRVLHNAVISATDAKPVESAKLTTA